MTLSRQANRNSCKQDAVVLQSNTKSPTGVHRPFIKGRDCGMPPGGPWLVSLDAA